MIELSNGHVLDYVVPSGGLDFHGRGYFWERPLVKWGLIRPELFAIGLKSLTLKPVKGNLRWLKPWTWLPWSPWSCIRFLDAGSMVNKVGLTNPGIESWMKRIAPTIDFKGQRIIGSIFGTRSELIELAQKFNQFDVIALEINVSCPNHAHTDEAEEIISTVRILRQISRHPIILKLSVKQKYLRIARALTDIIEAVSLNSVPWEMVFPDQRSSLHRLEQRVGGGGGGVSGRLAQKYNWHTVGQIANYTTVPVIGPSIVEYGDIAKVEAMGAKAFSFGAIHTRHPALPTKFVLRHMEEQRLKQGLLQIAKRA